MFAFRKIKEPYHLGEHPKEMFCARSCYKCHGNYVATRQRCALYVTLGLRKIRSPPIVIMITNLSRMRNDFSRVSEFHKSRTWTDISIKRNYRCNYHIYNDKLYDQTEGSVNYTDMHVSCTEEFH